MSKFCHQCQAKLNVTAKFCSQCGASQKNEPSYQAMPKTGTPKSSSESKQEFQSYDFNPDDPVKASVQKRFTPPSYEPTPREKDLPKISSTFSSSEKPLTPPTYSSRRPKDASRVLPPLSKGGSRSLQSKREKAQETARNFALWAAGIVLFPMPFYDLVVLMPIQTAMVISIGRIFENKEPPEKFLAHIAAACGASVFGQITTLFFSNLIPFFGSLISAPFIYGWTYGMGEVAIRYFENEGKVDKNEMRSVFKEVSKQATRAFKPSETLSAEESFEKIRGHLPPEEYEKLLDKFKKPRS